MRLCWHSSIYRGQVFRILCFLYSCIFFFGYINPFQHSAGVSPPDALWWGCKFGLRVYRLKLTLFLQIVLGKLKTWHSFHLEIPEWLLWRHWRSFSRLATCSLRFCFWGGVMGWLWKAKMLWIKAGDISWPWCFLCSFVLLQTQLDKNLN